jgi:hypothetical protein
VRGSNSCRGESLFISLKTSGHAVGPTQTPIQWVSLFFPECQAGTSVGRSPAWSSEVKNEWNCASNPPYSFVAGQE